MQGYMKRKKIHLLLIEKTDKNFCGISFLTVFLLNWQQKEKVVANLF
jgi:hypothetical protein